MTNQITENRHQNTKNKSSSKLIADWSVSNQRDRRIIIQTGRRYQIMGLISIFTNYILFYDRWWVFSKQLLSKHQHGVFFYFVNIWLFKKNRVIIDTRLIKLSQKCKKMSNLKLKLVEVWSLVDKAYRVLRKESKRENLLEWNWQVPNYSEMIEIVCDYPDGGIQLL